MSFLLCSNIKDPSQSVRPHVLIRVFHQCDVCNRIISNDSVFVCWSLRPSQSCYGISSRSINLLTFSWTGLVLQAVNQYFMHYEQRFCKRTAKGLIRLRKSAQSDQGLGCPHMSRRLLSHDAPQSSFLRRLEMRLQLIQVFFKIKLRACVEHESEQNEIL